MDGLLGTWGIPRKPCSRGGVTGESYPPSVSRRVWGGYGPRFDHPKCSRAERIRTSDLLNPMREESANKSDTPQPLTPDDPGGCTTDCTSPAEHASVPPPSPPLAGLL